MDLTSGAVLFSRQDGIGRITLNSPQTGNALDEAITAGMRAVAQKLDQETQLRVILLDARGANFCVGGNIKVISELGARGPGEIGRFIDEFHVFIRALRRHNAPVLAAVQGAAAGAGMSIMLAADFILAAQSSKFALAYRRLGTSSDGGATFFLPLRVGVAKAAELALLSERIDAPEALRIGLVNWLAKDEELEREALRIAAALASNAACASANFKRLLGAPMAAAFEAHLDLEREAFSACSRTADFKEGIAAFLEKRPAQFGRL